MKNPFSYIYTLVANRLHMPLKPSMLTYIVTFKCNARCIMCDSWKKKHEQELDYPQIDQMLSRLPRMDMVRLSGGEPFVRSDIADIVKSVGTHLRPSLLHITTNGLLTDRIVNLVENRNRRIPLFLLVSIDGMKEKHNSVRGLKDAWERVNNTIRTLAPLRKKLNFHISVNQTVVDREGIDQYIQLHDYLCPFDINNNLVVAYDESATYAVSPKGTVVMSKDAEFKPYGEFSKEDINELISQAQRRLHKYSFAERVAKRYYLQGIKNRLVHGIASPSSACVALSSHMRLYPDGSVPVCQFNSNIVGNLHEQSFDEVWYGENAEKYRQWVRRCPGCWAECEILPNAFYTGDIVRAL